MEVDDVGAAGTIDVRKPDAALVKLVRRVEPRRAVQGDFRPKHAKPEIWPITHLAVPYPHQIAQSVAGHVGEINRLRAVGKDDRWSLRLVPGLWHELGFAEAVLTQRWIPGQRVVFSNQDDGMPVAVKIHQAQVGVAHVAVDAPKEWLEARPTKVRRALIEPRCGVFERDHIQLAITREVHELGRAGRQQQVRPRGQELCGAESRARTELAGAVRLNMKRSAVAFVKPPVALFGENAGQSFAVQIDPLIFGPIETARHLLD